MPTEELIDKRPAILFYELKKYTQENFFSSDTIFKTYDDYSGYSFPEPRSNSEDSEYFYKNGLKIAHKGRNYRSQIPYNKQRCEIDNTILKEQLRVLTCKATIYTASLIYYYYKKFNMPSGNIYEKFNDNDFNHDLFRIFTQGKPEVVTANNRLEVTIPSDSSGAILAGGLADWNIIGGFRCAGCFWSSDLATSSDINTGINANIPLFSVRASPCANEDCVKYIIFRY